MKPSGQTWFRIDGKPEPGMVRRHLEGGGLSIGTLGRWYPEYGIIDIDDRNMDEVCTIRAAFNQSEHNSMLLASERTGHYHLLFRPVYNEKPPTLTLLEASLANLAREHHVEIYPQSQQTIRLPFGHGRPCLDHGRETLGWQDLFYWFKKLDDYDLGRVPVAGRNHGRSILPVRRSRGIPEWQGCAKEGKELLESGLVMPSSRHDAQFRVLYYLFRSGMDRAVAEKRTLIWIQDKHNGNSGTVNQGGWGIIQEEIKRQAATIWEHYQLPEPCLREYAEVFITEIGRASCRERV